MNCNCDCKKQNNEPVKVTTMKEGTWIQKGKEDIHIYSTSLCEGGNGSVIGFNNRALMESKIDATPLCVVIQDEKVFLQRTSSKNIMRHYNVDPNEFYELVMDFLEEVKAIAEEEPCREVDLNK